ncbi:MAG: SDR family NAD(P)-dependent oxidoreductase [Bacteroidales bacterium]
MIETGKHAIVTGAYGEIGKAITLGLLKREFRVTMVGRDSVNLRSTAKELARLTSEDAILFEVVDLSSHKEIVAFSHRWKGPLHLLVNNAATAPKKRTETPDGIEVQWATNVLGYFRMTNCFHPFMAGHPDARIVNVASYWAGGLDLNDLEFNSRPYNNDTAYRQAKQANRMLSAAFAQRLKAKGIMVNACHPGDVNSKLSNAFGFGGHESPEEGAATPLFLSVSDDVAGVTGQYYEHMKQVTCPFSKDHRAVDQLFEICDQKI